MSTEITDRVRQVIDALDCGCTRDEVRASAEALRGAAEAADPNSHSHG